MLAGLLLLVGGLLPVADYPIPARVYLAQWEIAGKTGAAPFALTGAQRILDWEVRQAREGGGAVLVKVLKARQQTISTWCCAYMQFLAQTIRGYGALSIADKKDLPRQWLRRAEGWYGQTALRRPHLAASNAIELYFDELQSRYWIASQGDQTPGMGYTAFGLHGSEVENWARAAKVFGDLLPAIPLNNPDACVILESTGELEGGYWHEQVMASVQGADSYKLIFLPWWISPEYSEVSLPESERATLAAGFGPADYAARERHLVSLARQWARDNPLYAHLAKFSGELSPGQILWRRYVVANMFAGDEEMFACRYPATVAEAFLGAGSLAIPAKIVHHHAGQVRDPEWYRLEWEDVAKTKVHTVPCESGDPMGWRFYVPRDPETAYSIGADVASGKLSDRLDDRSERDYATIGVLDRKRKQTAALFRARVEGNVLGREMLKAGAFWNDAWMASEVNEYGWATLEVIREYPYLMPREGAPDLQKRETSLNRLCWETTGATRNLLIDTWIEACREVEHTGWGNSIHCLSQELVAEERTFVVKPDGKREHRAGCHDDVLFAYMIASIVDRRCPLVLPQDIREEARPRLPDEIRDLVAQPAPQGSYSGQTDPWTAEMDEEDEN